MTYTIRYKTAFSPEREDYFAAPTTRLLVTRAGHPLTVPILSALFGLWRRK